MAALFVRAKIKDLIQKKIKINPLKSIISLETSAQIFSNKFPLIMLLEKSKPPIKISKPNTTTMCINNFFLFGILIAKKENNNKGIPKKVGINEVKELLPLKKETPTPQNIKNIPYNS